MIEISKSDFQEFCDGTLELTGCLLKEIKGLTHAIGGLGILLEKKGGISLAELQEIERELDANTQISLALGEIEKKLKEKVDSP
jgi:hypothetical protein